MDNAPPVLPPDWLGLLAAAVAWGFALYVFFVARKGVTANYLIALLVVDGIAVATGLGTPNLIDPKLESLGLPALTRLVHQMSDWAVVFIYLPFLGLTLASPLVAPFKRSVVRRTVLFTGFSAVSALPFLSESLQETLRPYGYAFLCLALLWGLFAAVNSWAITRQPAQRARARAFTFAFGLRDLLWLYVFAFNVGMEVGWVQPWNWSAENKWIGIWIYELSYTVAVMLYVPLLAYGVLRVQLFDIDLRIKRTLRRGTVAAAFVATFFVISELASIYLSELLGNFLGIVATGALVFLLDPLQRAAEKLSNAAMPGTVSTPEYETFRKLQVYDSAVRTVAEDGGIDLRHRPFLDNLVESLGIDQNLARKIEEEVVTKS